MSLTIATSSATHRRASRIPGPQKPWLLAATSKQSSASAMASSDSAANRPASAPANGTSLPPLTDGALVLGSVALSLATFMNVLDLSIANVSIPAISGDLGVSPNQGTWVITSFGVANAISVPLTGWLTTRFGAVRLFVLSILLFVLSSWLCGVAPNLE